MKTLKIFSLIAAVGFLASCSSNRDLVSLDEYDDLYYQGNDHAAAQKPAQKSEFYPEDKADAAEAAYYGVDGYNEGPADAEPIDESTAETNGDAEYYDPDYARRIDNFHRSDEPEYIYNRAYDSSPSVRWSLGFSTFGPYSGFGFGMSYGNLYRPYGYPYYSPFMDPWYFRTSYWYSPFYYRPYYSPFFDPWAPYPYYSPYAMYNPYRYGYGYGYPYYGGGYPPYYGGSDSYQSNTEYGPRDNSSRSSRGGVVRSGERGTIQEGPKSEQTRDSRTMDSRERTTRTRENVTEGSDYYNRSERDRVLRDQENTRMPRTREDVRSPRENVSQPRRTEPLTSPYTRQRTRTYDAPDYSRSRTTPTPSQPSRPRIAPNRDNRAPTRDYSAPSNNRIQRSAPSTSPTPSRNSRGSGTSSPSPSRSTRSR